jgi:hypothetical protein
MPVVTARLPRVADPIGQVVIVENLPKSSLGEMTEFFLGGWGPLHCLHGFCNNYNLRD